MSKSKSHLWEVEEMSDEKAIEHSRSKMARYDDKISSTVADDEPGDDSEVAESAYKSKHTLDSDEEDDIKYEKLDIDKIEGQEEAREEDFEGGTKITAFNMVEDLEDGHFDADGNFIFNKKQQEIKDAWLDNIDWGNVKNAAGDQWGVTNEEDESTLKMMGDGELINVYKKIAAILKSNETIERALKRLGKQKGLSATEERKQRWAAKKAGKEYVDEGSAILKELTGLADSLVSKGEMEAYQYTLEKLQHLIHEMEHKAVDELDMFSDLPSSSPKEATSATSDAPGAINGTEETTTGSAVSWEYKLSDSDTAEVVGPLSSEEMLKLQESGKFEEGGWARKLGTQAFYSIARLDFEIYT